MNRRQRNDCLTSASTLDLRIVTTLKGLQIRQSCDNLVCISHTGKRLQAQYRWGIVTESLGPLGLGSSRPRLGHLVFCADPGWAAATAVDADAVAIGAPRRAMLPVKRNARARFATLARGRRTTGWKGTGRLLKSVGVGGRSPDLRSWSPNQFWAPFIVFATLKIRQLRCRKNYLNKHYQNQILGRRTLAGYLRSTVI